MSTREGRTGDSPQFFRELKEGHRIPVRVRVAPIRGPAGWISGAVEVLSENSATVEALMYEDKKTGGNAVAFAPVP